MDQLHPTIDVSGTPHRVIIEELGGVQRATLGRIVGSAEPERYALIRALDQLFTGI